MSSVGPTVWFVCKSCNLFFAQVDGFIEHKKETHFTEFQIQNTGYIVFEERIDVDFDNENSSVETKPIILKEEFQLANENISEEGPDPLIIKEEFQLTNDSQLETSNDLDPSASHLPAQTNSWASSDNLVPKTELVTYEREIEEPETILVDPPLQPEYMPYILVKRLTSTEIESASSADDDQESTLGKNNPSRKKRNPEKYKFQCQLCLKKFTSISHVKLHGDSHKTPEQRQIHKCSVCERPFLSKYRLDQHVKTHSVSSYFECTQLHCEKTFRSSLSLQKHLLETHSNERPFRCPKPDCESKFKTNSKLKRHIKIIHSDERPFGCPQCSKTFKLRYNLELHLKIHTGERLYICSIDDCSKTFAVPTNLRRHRINIHGHKNTTIGIGPKHDLIPAPLKRPTSNEVLTEGVSSATSRKLKLNKNLTTQPARRPFKCTQLNCGKEFKVKRNLDAHMKSHSSVRPFSCSQCDKTFKFHFQLVGHGRVHTGERPYKCPVDNCGKIYAKAQGLWRHKRSAHNDES